MSDMQATERANNIAREAMETAHTECNRVYTHVDGIRDDLRTSWQGAASNRYSEALVSWLEELRLITNDMSTMIGTFGGTVREMQQMEDTNIIEGSGWMDDLNPGMMR
ncbi:WXG100 family type VII secretion target [Actinorugispora endophytica]|uniref:WXG100 family type VII secretion target n=1 Tax=Actinorugispora endophytica TaxID=1605990 RepID=A0A4R6UH95_9ACTN|nr:hypothetical protein [Actinorugispora endophytica]TDQ44659.1 hypothetical protein EV190_1348 [Actinorugispora endophytica]